MGTAMSPSAAETPLLIIVPSDPADPSKFDEIRDYIAERSGDLQLPNLPEQGILYSLDVRSGVGRKIATVAGGEDERGDHDELYGRPTHSGSSVMRRIGVVHGGEGRRSHPQRPRQY